MFRLHESFTFLTFKAVYSLQDVRMYLLFRAVDPLLLYIFFASMGASILGSEYIHFIVIGNIFFITARTFFFGLIGMFRYERQFGTLGLNVCAPTSTFTLILRRLLIPFIDSLFVILVSLMYAYVIFGIQIKWTSLPALVIFILVLLFSSGALALISASISLTFKDINLFTNVIIGGMQILCGVYFPITLLPHFVQLISTWLPLTNSIIGIRFILEGKPFGDTYVYLLKELIIGFLLFIVAAIMIKMMEGIAKRSGSLVEIE
ncbi:ABC transporter permease [Robertmurraya siralis]|uniref:ABC transporter permease n=1 Tax=Robertmurraya siralis TaxID=77777 RepID=UPI000BA62F50|nr:ABC transporter permease [Robertmurraya siralis]PAE18284.1 hypothetical protein CHH80_22470 [Bacillus sp. 7504-2]